MKKFLFLFYLLLLILLMCCDPAPVDQDGDGINDGSDNCINTPNADQDDMDGDNIGDACDDDKDGDGVQNATDNCPEVPNEGQEDMDGDGMGDMCDIDRDGDGVLNLTDNCPDVPNDGQEDQDFDGIGDACDPDYVLNCGLDGVDQFAGFNIKYFLDPKCETIEQPISYPFMFNSWGVTMALQMDWTSTQNRGFFRQNINGIWPTIQEDYPGLNGPFEFGVRVQFKTSNHQSNFDADNWIVFANILHQDIPHADPVYSYQYGFVFDRDGNPNNNYQPHPSYPLDFFQDTDFWVVANYDPVNGWGLTISDATDGVITTAVSEAKMLILGNTIFVFIPRSEFYSQNVGYRITCYKHPGDWGVGGDWSGDVQPSVADGLTIVDVGP